MTRHILKITDLSKDELLAIVDKAIDLKAHPEKYSAALQGKTLMMMFEKPSLRTRISFEVGMTQLGGHAIFVATGDSPIGVKESYADAAAVLSRMVNIVMARVKSRDQVRGLSAAATIPIINALDDFAHPCQMLADIQCIMEKKGKDVIKTLKMAYLGDGHNNVTYDLMRMAALLGYTCNVACPKGPGFDIEQEVLDECEALCKKTGGVVKVFDKAADAVVGVDVVYADSWMSYGIPKEESERRTEIFMPYQVTSDLMKLAKPDAIFMNCLPCIRGAEMTAEVVDGPQSVIFDEAENRLHSCKALMLFLLGVGGFPKPSDRPAQ